MRPVHATPLDAFELRVALRHIKPPIWRLIRVPTDITLGTLHDVLQTAFGWTNSHLHDFQVDAITFGVADVEDERFVVDEHAAPLGAIAQAGSFLYRYDFGDGWEHAVTVERLIENGAGITECTDGARAGPPEDCGGPPGYENLVKALANPKHPEHRELRGWVGRRYDPETFDRNALNKKLATLSRRWRRARA